MRFTWLWLLWLAAVAAASNPAPVKPAPRTAQAAPARPDIEIEKAIRVRFARSKIAVNHFEVRVQGGVAIIEGQTGVIQHKGVATRLAKLGGAKAVNNRIRISDAAKEKAAANLAEGRRRVQVKRDER